MEYNLKVINIYEEDTTQVCPFCSFSLKLCMLTRGLAIVMPDDVAEEKVAALRALGADIQRVRPASIVDKKQVWSPKSSLAMT
jgi:hypothetical protein